MTIKITIKKIIVAAVLITVTATVAKSITIEVDKDFKNYMEGRSTIEALAAK